MPEVKVSVHTPAWPKVLAKSRSVKRAEFAQSVVCKCFVTALCASTFKRRFEAGSAARPPAASEGEVDTKTTGSIAWQAAMRVVLVNMQRGQDRGARVSTTAWRTAESAKSSGKDGMGWAGFLEASGCAGTPCT